MANVVSLTSSESVAEFESISAALKEATSGDTLTLLDDISISTRGYTFSGIDVTLDLAGHTFTAQTWPLILSDAAHLTLKDSSEEKTGKVVSAKGSAVGLGSDSKYSFKNVFTLESGSIESQEFGVIVFGNSVININGGSILSHDNAAVGSNGQAKFADYPYEINITGGEIVAETKSAGYANCAIYACNAGQVNISGGSIIGKNGAGVVIRGGDVKVTGGYIAGQGTTSGLKMGDANPTYCGGIEICNAANYPGKIGTCEIYGGEIVSDASSALLVIGNPEEYSNCENSEAFVYGGSFEGQPAINYVTKSGEIIKDSSTSKISVSGGIFSSDVQNYLESEIKLSKVANADGSTSYVIKDDLGSILKNTEEIKSLSEETADRLFDLDVRATVTNAKLGDISDDVSSISSKLTSTNAKVDNVGTKVDSAKTSLSGKLDTVGSKIDSANTATNINIDEVEAKVDIVNQRLSASNTNTSNILSKATATDEKLKSLNSTASSIKSTGEDTNDKLKSVKSTVEEIDELTKSIKSTAESIDSTSSNIKTNTDTLVTTTDKIEVTTESIDAQLTQLIDETIKIVDLDKKLLTQVIKLLGDDPTSILGEDSQSSEESIQLLMIQSAVKNARATGENRVVWQHPMNDVVRSYCESNGYVVTPYFGISIHANLGDQWLIIISE